MRWALALLLVVACDASPGEPPSAPAVPAPSGAPSSPPSPSITAPAPAHLASEELRRCAEAEGDLSSISDAVSRLNALAPLADGPCFVATLPRPLAVVATLGTTSAQPAAGRTSPRIFFLLPKLVVSAVPAGDGSKVLEFGQWVTATRTLKGEIGLPVTAPLAQNAPFERVLYNDRSTCGGCHRQEEPHPTIPNAFVSTAFKPEPGTLMAVSELEDLHDTCTRDGDTSTRCTMFHAIFDFGKVTDGAYAPEVETFFAR